MNYNKTQDFFGDTSVFWSNYKEFDYPNELCNFKKVKKIAPMIMQETNVAPKYESESFLNVALWLQCVTNLFLSNWGDAIKNDY